MMRTCIFLLLTCSLSQGQVPLCSALRLVAERRHDRAAWGVYVRNASSKDIRIHIPPQQYRWVIEKQGGTKKEIVLTGGVGSGVSSSGTAPTTDNDTFTIRRGHKQLLADFDLRRDASTESFENGAAYRIFFEQQVELVGSNGTLGPCTLRSSPEVFRGGVKRK